MKRFHVHLGLESLDSGRVLFAGGGATGGRKCVLRPGGDQCGRLMLRTRHPQGICGLL